jgi:hypothetical protein
VAFAIIVGGAFLIFLLIAYVLPCSVTMISESFWLTLFTSYLAAYLLDSVVDGDLHHIAALLGWLNRHHMPQITSHRHNIRQIIRALKAPMAQARRITVVNRTGLSCNSLRMRTDQEIKCIRLPMDHRLGRHKFGGN